MRILRGLSIMLLAVISSALLANEQVLVLSESEIELASFSSEQTVSVSYATSPLGLNATGLGITMFFDSSKLSIEKLDVLFSESLVGATELSSLFQEDVNNQDSDPSTDTIAILAYLDLDGAWPNRTEQLLLFEFSVRSSDENFSGFSIINFLTTPAINFSSTLKSVKVVSSNLSDFDGDGIPDIDDPDDDNDGIADEVDAFPFNSGEAFDTDGDSIGNNADTDDDGDGVLDAEDAFPLDASESIDTDGDSIGNNADTDDDNDGVLDAEDAFPLDPTQSVADSDTDGLADDVDNCPAIANADQADFDEDGVGDACDDDDDNDGVSDSADVFPLDASESIDTDGDGLGNNADTDDDGDGYSDQEENLLGTDPLNPASCPGCFSWDVDKNGEVTALSDGLIIIRYLFSFSGSSLISDALGSGAERSTASEIENYLSSAGLQLDIDGDGEVKPLTDGLILLRYLFGFEGENLIRDAVSDTATRKTAEDVSAYIVERLPGAMR